jgi:hypothetical protein
LVNAGADEIKNYVGGFCVLVGIVVISYLIGNLKVL